MKTILTTLFGLSLFAVMAFTMPEQAADDLNLIPIDTDIQISDQKSNDFDEFDFEAIQLKLLILIHLLCSRWQFCIFKIN